MTKRILAISNHAVMLGGGEHSYFDLICRLPSDFSVTASLPADDVLAKKIRDAGIETAIIPLPPIDPFHAGKMVHSVRLFIKLCATQHANIIYANGSRAAFYGGLAARFSRIPLVWHCRISEPDPRLDFMLARLAFRIIVNSQATASRFAPGFRNKINVVYNGFDLKWLREPGVTPPALIRKDWKPVLVVARVSKSKRHDVILSAFEKTAVLEKEAHLILIGGKDQDETAWWEELKERTRHSHFSERIHWVGAVDDVRPWYKSASAMVLPSINEAFGRVVVEAMACGVPVIASRSGGIPEIITHMLNGILVSEKDSCAIAEALRQILNNQTLSRSISEEAQKRAEFFSIEKAVESIAAVFKSSLRAVEQ